MLEDTLLRTLLLITTLNSTVLVLCMFVTLIYLRQIFNSIVVIGSILLADSSEDVDEDISVEEK